MNKSVLFALCAFIRVSIRADIYLYIDKMGDQHFSEHQENTKYKLLLRSESNHVTGSFKNWKEKSYRYVSIPQKHHLQNKYHPLIMIAAQNHQLEPAFIHAVITAESAYNHKAVSSAGAQGLMQLMPMTAKRFGVRDSFDPHQNINAGSLYLKKLLAEFQSKEFALAAYNAGEGTVRKYNNQIPPYPETQRYVKKVMKFYAHYKINMASVSY
ncbi:MAG TPA: lytic transglycosylase domain-containing protein [Psychromonas hadalis]|nr:lytic transglycosylase domain-containing protein [Psychromonas hadalis]